MSSNNKQFFKVRNLAYSGLALVSAANVTGQVLFNDDFETDTSSNWSIVEGSDNGIPDYTAEFGFDYGAVTITENGESASIPPAPNSDGTTTGLKLTVNNNDEEGSPSGVSVFPVGQNFSGNFTLKFDMWINYNGGSFGGSGSTEHATFGINASGNTPAWTVGNTLQNGDGSWFAVSGEGGASRDMRSVIGEEMFPPPIELFDVDAGYLDRDLDGTAEFETNPTNSADPTWPLGLIFSPDRFETPGSPGKDWVQVEIRYLNGATSWFMDGYLIAENFLAIQTSGNIMLGYLDAFGSIANPSEDNFVIYDNVRVEDLSAAPTPIEISIFADSPNVTEAEGSAMFTLNRTGDVTEALDVSYVVAGDATSGEDYETPAGVVTFAAGSSTASIEIPTLDDDLGEGPEEVIVFLEGNPSAYDLRDQVMATVVIDDNGDTPTVSIAATDPHMYERMSDDTGTVVFSLPAPSPADLNLQLTVTGTAVDGTDYSTDMFLDTLLLPTGAEELVVTFTPLDNSELDGLKDIIIELAAGDNYLVGSETTVTLEIRDDEKIDGVSVLFSEDFETDVSSQWDVIFDSNNGVDDYMAEFNWNYANDLIPPAPGSNTTFGLMLAVNQDAEGSAAAVNVFPSGQSFSGNYAVRFNMFISLDPQAGGSTEHSIAGINHSGTAAVRHGVPGGDGVFFAVNGDGSNLRNYTTYTYPTEGEAPAVDTPPIDDFAPLFTEPAFFPGGSPSSAWVDVEIVQENGVISWYINGALIDQVTNPFGYTEGNIMLGHNDQYNSTGSLFNYVVFDNVEVVQLEGGATGNLYDTISTDARFSTLKTAIDAAGLQSALEGDDPLTILAPTNEAFGKLPAGTVEALLGDPEALTDLLLYHVIPGTAPASVVTTLNAALTLAGKRVFISMDGTTVMINDSAVVETDIAATNGLIHAIDLPLSVVTVNSAWNFDNPVADPALLGGIPGTITDLPPTSTDSPSGADGDLSLSFDGTSGAFYEDTSGMLNFDNEDFTLQGWVKFDTFTEPSKIIIASYGLPGGYSFWVTTERKVGATTYGILDFFSEATVPDDGGWHHIAVVHENGVEARFYVDGELGDTIEYTGGVLTTSDNHLHIGFERGSDIALNPFNGLIDRVIVTGAALAPEDLDYPAAEQGPELMVELTTDGLLISWPDEEGYYLESKPGLSATEWTTVVSGEEITVIDGVASTIVPTTEAVEVFRLNNE